MAKERIRESQLLVRDHVDYTDDPGSMQQCQLGRPSPEGIGDCQVRVMLRGHDIQKWVVQHSQDAMVSELQFQPRSPVAAVGSHFVGLAFVELDRVIPVSLGELVLRFR